MVKKNEGEFDAKVDAWIAKSERLLLAVFQQSAQEVIELMQVPTAKGGRMRVDTGFLRSSLQVTINSPYQGFRQRDNAKGDYSWDDLRVSLTINRARLGDVVYAVYTANYAAPREYGARGQAGDFFVRGAAQQWPQIVARNVRKLRG